MASIAELYTDEQNLVSFHRELGEELERMKDVKNPETRSRMIKKIQVQMFETALKLSFPSVKEY